MKKISAIAYILLFIVFSCKKDQKIYGEKPYTLEVPPGFSSPAIPPDNPMTRLKISLGKRLFQDKILSSDSSISCSSCHQPARAFTDDLQVSVGVKGRLGNRNVPTLANMAWYPYFFMEGGSPSLELQMLGPIESVHEMNLPFPEAVKRLQKHPTYPELFKNAFGKGPTAFTLTRAIAAYERTLISGNSAYDQYRYQGNSAAMNASAIRGMALFESKELNCSKCHSGFLFTDFSFQNNGLYKTYVDPGRSRLTGEDADRGKFKVPTLRNIALTAPYMHDGSLQTLSEVVDHYASGGKENPNKSSLIKGFVLNPQQKEDLIAFLKSLSDSSFVSQ